LAKTGWRERFQCKIGSSIVRLKDLNVKNNVVDELMSSLQAHEQKIVKRNGDKAIEHALQVKLSLKERYEQGETSTSGYTTQARNQQSRGGF